MELHFKSYLVLGVTPGASPEEIKRAYRALARRWHPDRVQGDDAARRLAESKLREINRAYHALKGAPALNQHRHGSRPANPGYDSFNWRENAAAQGRAAESLEDDRSFYERALNLHFEGMAHFRTLRFREAVSSLLQSVCLVQDNPEAHRSLGRAYRRLNLPQK